MGAPVDLVKPGVNGWVVRSGDSDSLHSALSAAAKISSEALGSMSAAAKRSVAGHQLEDGVTRFQEAAEGTFQSWKDPSIPPLRGGKEWRKTPCLKVPE
jgi:hypothetical protein